MKSAHALASLLLLGGGCAGWTVHSDTSPGAQLGRYQTYAWAQESTDDPLLDQRVRDQVTAQLAQKGIQPAAPGRTPDFLVGYFTESGPRVQNVVNADIPYAPSASGGVATPLLPPATYVYTEQALVIDFMDARTGRVFWRGYASYVVDKPPEVAPGKAQQAVSRILRKYPAELASAPRPSG